MEFYSIEIKQREYLSLMGKYTMVMRRKNSPQILQRIMERIFRDMKGKGVEIFLDDIVFHSKSLRELVRKI